MERNEVLAKLRKRHLELPTPPKPGGYYDSVRLLGGIAYVAVQFPFIEDRLLYVGRIGDDVSTQQGYEAAEVCALNVLAQMDKHVGFENVLGLNSIEAMMQTAAGWDEFPLVLDGASRLFLDILGDSGRHARSLMGVERLPLNSPIALTATFTTSV